MPWNGVRKTIWAKNFDEMEIIGTIHFSVAVPIEADPEFKAMVLAAGVAHSGGNKSIDYVYHRYSDVFLDRFDPDKTCPAGCIKELLLKIRITAVRISEQLSELKIPQELPFGAASGANALIRLRATFHASIQLSLSGFGIESEAVIRQGLEQLAWSLRVLEIDDPDKSQKIAPNTCISSLKSTFPGAGFIYGMLSNSAHLSPSTHGRFLSYEEDEVTISIRNPDDCANSALFLLLLLDAYSYVSHQFAMRGEVLPSKPPDHCSELIDTYEQVLPSHAAEWFQRWRANSSQVNGEVN